MKQKNIYWKCPECGREATGLPITPATVSFFCGKCGIWENLKKASKPKVVKKEKVKRVRKKEEVR